MTWFSGVSPRYDTMHLPEKYSNRFELDHDKNSIESGDMLYYACDGSIHEVVAISENHLITFDEWSDEELVFERDYDLLGSDFFPLSAK